MASFMLSSTYAVNFLQDFYDDNTHSCFSVWALNKSWGMKSSLQRPSRICGIWWAMAEKWPASLWQVCICGRPSPWRQDYPACRVRVLCVFVCKSCWSQAEDWYLWCAWEPPCHLSLRAVTVRCLEQPGGVGVVSVVEAWMWIRLHCTSRSWAFPGNRDAAHSFAQVQNWGLMKHQKPDTVSLTTVACTDAKNPSFSVTTFCFSQSLA